MLYCPFRTVSQRHGMARCDRSGPLYGNYEGAWYSGSSNGPIGDIPCIGEEIATPEHASRAPSMDM